MSRASKTKPRSRNQGGAEQPQLELPDAISKRGPVQLALETAAQNTADGSKTLAERYLDRLRLVRSVTRKELGDGPHSRKNTSAKVREVLARKVTDDDGHASFLCGVLLEALGGKQPADRAEAAGTWYVAHRATVDRVLGDLVPVETRRWAAEQSFRLGLNETASEDFGYFCGTLNEFGTNRLSGIATGIPPLDRVIGGVRELTIVAGSPMSGKTSLVQKIAYEVVRADDTFSCLFVDAEQGRSALLLRWLALASGISVKRLLSRQLSASELREEAKARKRLTTEFLPFVRVEVLPPDTRETDENFPDASWFIRAIKRTLAATKRRKCLVAIDSLQRLPVAGPEVAVPGEERTVRPKLPEHELARARMNLLLGVQRRTVSNFSPAGFPFVVVSRCRKTDGKEHLDVEDVYGGIESAYDASTVILLDPDGEPSATDVTPVTLRVGKHRNGHTGTVKMDFHHLHADFRERSTGMSSQSTPKSAASRFAGKS